MYIEPINATLRSILCNQQQPDGTHRKVSLPGRARIHSHGIESEQGLKEEYDDPDCALMHYALEHYAFWQTRYPGQASLFSSPGLFGENLSTCGMTEHTVCLGDIFQLGTATIQVSWGREACRTMAARLNDAQVPEIMHQQSRNGWFYRVLQAGEIQCGNVFTLLERPNSGWFLSRIQNSIFNPNAEKKTLEAIGNLTGLAEPWRRQIEDRLKN